MQVYDSGEAEVDGLVCLMEPQPQTVAMEMEIRNGGDD